MYYEIVYMLVNVNVIYYVHVCEQARWARSAGNSAIENLCIIIINGETICAQYAEKGTLSHNYVQRSGSHRTYAFHATVSLFSA